MSLIKGGAFVSALAMAALSAGVASADCKQTCNTGYAACGQSGKDTLQCLNGWRTCKMQCSGGPAFTPVATVGQPKGGVMQKASVKVVAPAKR